MRSPTTTGEEWPGGSAVFQTTLVVGPSSAGRRALSARPQQLRPRNSGQSAAQLWGAKQWAARRLSHTRANPPPRPPPRNGEGEKDSLCSPSPLRGGGGGEGLGPKVLSPTSPAVFGMVFLVMSSGGMQVALRGQGRVHASKVTRIITRRLIGSRSAA